jgi:hypothetical protein
VDSFTQIAIEMAGRIARLQHCEVDTFSLDGVEITEGENGEETIVIQASAKITPVRDEIPFELTAG